MTALSSALQTPAVETGTMRGHETVFVNEFTNGILDPGQPMLGPVRDGGHIVANTAPGCWGPMITPAIRGGHEVTRPVAVAGAEVGDAIVIRIKDITVTSLATSSGNDRIMSGRFLGDPYVAGKCPQCGTLYPKTVLRGIGQTAVRCANCGADASPFTFTNGYTIVFDANRSVGITLHKEAAEAIAWEAKRYAALPDNSIQNPILTFAPHDLVGLVARLRPFMGQLGTTPSIPFPDSHNAGDFGSFLIGAPHEYGLSAEQLAHRTDGHMDIDAVRAGAILICPVKTPGGGVYLGDMHALQGDGEIAGHTCDVSGTVTLQVHVLKNLPIDGPILLPVAEDLPFLAKPLSAEEKARALAIARQWGLEALEESAPISVIGTGPDLNAATDNGLERAARLLEMSVPEVKNRATITGAIEIGRHPGVVQITFRAPLDRLEKVGLLPFVQEQYGVA
ncbi:MAG: acetamidase/formamidase family protein [Caldilinea sp.]|jgi:formamidase|uniref:Acetamidase/formamidase family protein n=2 Tax=Caldilineaceae TaxID=475964 RepID=I0I7G6_CALAS|nr:MULTISPECIES: acetamidase/formamidase family protein [Caldilinea]MBO9391912.1 acetamidase/formamidase family protein [Caldilinea sp.]BAM01204.1 acetamidase/formamidase family protein [Caldilinea aerophila DSM 14535 = NBRC 104270]GIV72546.1 MAG: acetamidase [Caldilinea sp.]